MIFIFLDNLEKISHALRLFNLC